MAPYFRLGLLWATVALVIGVAAHAGWFLRCVATGAVSIDLGSVPALNRLFHTAPLSGEAWLRVAGVGAVVYVMVEIEKWVRAMVAGRRQRVAI